MKRPAPAPTIRRRIVAALVAVALGVAALLGISSFESTERLLRAEIDRSLASAASTLSAGGTVAAIIAEGRSDGRGQPDGGNGGPSGRGGGQEGIVQSAQTIAADGTVTVLTGVQLPVSADSAALSGDNAGTQQVDTVTVDGTEYRVLAVSLGDQRGVIQVARDLTITEAVLSNLAWTTVAISVAVLLLAALAGWWIARQITRRLTALTAAAEQIAVTGTLDLGVQPRGRDEVARLGEAMQGMLGELARSRDDQRRLVQDAGHELRTPLTSLRTNISVLRRYDELSPASRSRLLDDVGSETRELTNLINELVELAIDRRDAEPSETFDVADVAERIVERYRRRSHRAITLTADRPLLIDGRRHSIERAISNLLDNAIKFDPDGAQPIDVAITRHDQDVRVEVADRGPGFDPADADRLFDRFYRTDAARSRPGSGLGLAIVRDVATSHGGITSATPRPGGGAIIAFTLAGTPVLT